MFFAIVNYSVRQIERSIFVRFQTTFVRNWFRTFVAALVSRHIPQRGQFRTASTNPCRDSLSLVGSTLFRSRHLNLLMMLSARIDSQVVFQASWNCSSPSPHFAATLFVNFQLSFFLLSKIITTAHAHKSGVIFHFFPRAFKQTKN